MGLEQFRNKRSDSHQTDVGKNLEAAFNFRLRRVQLFWYSFSTMTEWCPSVIISELVIVLWVSGMSLQLFVAPSRGVRELGIWFPCHRQNRRTVVFGLFERVARGFRATRASGVVLRRVGELASMNAHLPFRKNWSSSASVNAGRMIALVMFSFPGRFLADFFRLRYFSIFSKSFSWRG